MSSFYTLSSSESPVAPMCVYMLKISHNIPGCYNVYILQLPHHLLHPIFLIIPSFTKRTPDPPPSSPSSSSSSPPPPQVQSAIGDLRRWTVITYTMWSFIYLFPTGVCYNKCLSRAVLWNKSNQIKKIKKKCCSTSRLHFNVIDTMKASSKFLNSLFFK